MQEKIHIAVILSKINFQHQTFFRQMSSVEKYQIAPTKAVVRVCTIIAEA